MKKETASTKSVQEFRDAVAASLGAGSAVLLNLIDVLATWPRLGSPVELTLSAMFAYGWSSLYRALRRAEGQLLWFGESFGVAKSGRFSRQFVAQ